MHLFMELGSCFMILGGWLECLFICIADHHGASYMV